MVNVYIRVNGANGLPIGLMKLVGLNGANGKTDNGNRFINPSLV